MTERKRDMNPDWIDPDEIPDLTDAPLAEKMDAAPVRRGRPKSVSPKVATTIRLDADVMEHFRASGEGWQTRINKALRAAAGL